METIESKVINDWLKDQANVPLSTKPMFRLVFSDEQFETRRGLIDHYIGRIKVSTSEEISAFPKYSWIKERWVLEQWYPPEYCYSSELPDTVNGSYEPIYVFESSKGEALPLNLLVCQLIVSRCLKPSSSPDAIRSRIKLEHEIKEAELDAYTEDSIDVSPMASLIHNHEAGLVPANYDVLSPNLRNKQ